LANCPRATSISCPCLSIASISEDAFGENLREIAAAAGIKEWPHNAMRHSFGSYFFAKSKNENLTASEMGNSPAMVFQHYRALVKDAEATQYWALQPDP
jgi:hypothetical protein